MSPPAITEPLFYHPALASADEVVLPEAEARHVAAQRLRAGDAIALFDGRGNLARGRIESLDRKAVRVCVTQRSQASPPAPAIDLYSALPKGDRQAVLLDTATQLGMSRFVPVHWQRSVVEPGTRSRERWQRICVEACKQSRRLHVPEMGEVTPLARAVAAARADEARLLLAHVSPDARPVLTLDFSGGARYALFIGPEGGVTDSEAEHLRSHGAGIVRLGEAVLRVETAAAAMIALVRAACEPFPSARARPD